MREGPQIRTQAESGRLVSAIPLVWLLAFFLVPALVVLKISFSQVAVAQPPYVPTFDFAAGWQGLKTFIGGLTTENYALLLRDRLYVDSYLRSIEIAAASTLALLVVGYPVAYAIARAPRGAQNLLLLLIILPFWTAFLIRIYAWVVILQRDGLLNSLLLALGVIDAPLGWLATDTAIYIGIVYSYLPFMVLPLYARLERTDPTLYEAAADLGCPPWKAFWLVTVPLSLPGVAAGVLLCFIPIVGEFVIPDLLGGSSTLMIGQTLWSEFFANRDWPLASAVAVVMLIALLIPILIYQRLQMRALARGA